MCQVQVCISTPDPDRVSNLIDIFDKDLFEVKTVIIQNPSGIVRSNFDLEAHRLIEVLKKCDPKRPCLYIKDNSVSNISKKKLSRITQSILKQNNWDLAYYGYWLDRCDLYGRNNFIPYLIPKTNSYIVRTTSPNGLQAIMFSPKGRHIILGEKKMSNNKFFVLNTSISNSLKSNIENGNIKALAVTPRVFNYNVLLSSSVSDLAKMSACRRPQAKNNSSKSNFINEINPLFWFIGIVFLVVLILWSLYYLGKRSSHKKKEQ